MNVPAKLKSADISRFAQRAAQVESLKPPVAYWCYFWIVKQILGNGLHTADDASKAYTTKIMDKLEEMKAEHASEDAITDDIAGRAYVEQFGLETFQRADNTVRANKATRITADTFQASATFLELVSIWGPPSPEIVTKIRFAKFHALRIAKAIKAGEDPNLSNPVPEPLPSEDLVALDPNDPEVREIIGADNPPSIAEAPEGQTHTAQDPARDAVSAASLHTPNEPPRPVSPMWPPTKHRQPSVTDVPDEHDRLQRSLAAQSTLDESLHPSRAPSIPRQPQQDQAPDAPAPTAGPISPPAQAAPSAPQPDSVPRQSPADGGYFPNVGLPEAPNDPRDPMPGPTGPISPSGYVQPPHAPTSPNPQQFYGNPMNPSPAQAGPFSPPALPQPPPQHHAFPAAQHPPVPPLATYQQTYQPPPQQFVPAPMASNAPQSYLADDASVLAAQKHAKFAISALNFEDVPTAVKELRDALRSLGAS